MTTLQIIEASAALFIYVITHFFISRKIDRIVANNVYIRTRSKIVKKAINLTMLVIFIAIIFSIFGVHQSDLAVFVGSVLTVIGIALFAQWSILANITSGIILFLNHPVSLDDTIAILDKDYEIAGRISDIGLFFVILETGDNEQVTIPNSVFLNKMIKKKTNI